MLTRGDRLPDFHAPLRDGSSLLLSDDAAGLPVLIVVGGAHPRTAASAVVLHLTSADEAARCDEGLCVVDDGSIAQALTGGMPGVVAAGADHRVLASGAPNQLDVVAGALAATRRLAPRLIRTAVPIATVADVLDGDECDELIAAAGGLWQASPSHRPDTSGNGFELQVDETRKNRLDHALPDGDLFDMVVDRMQRRLVPEIVRGFAHRPTSFERPKVVRYPTDGFFAGHRDSTTADAAHRRLAVTVNLDDGYQGGELTFPEFGPDLYSPAAGAAIVFSCGLYHSVAPVTAGERHALITFLW